MKTKKIALAMITPLLLAGCGKTSVTLPFKVLTPTGAPSVAFYNYINDDNFETNAVPTNIISAMGPSSLYDLVVIDTTSGIQAISNGSPYLLASTITFGNFYIASTGNDDNNTMDKGDNIVLFGGKAAIPNKIFHYLYGDVFDETIEYVSAVKDASVCLITGKNAGTGSAIDYVFIAEPVLSKALEKSANASIYQDIQELYKIKSNNLPLMQASIFIKESANRNDVNKVLLDLQKDIKTALKNQDALKTTLLNKSDDDTITRKLGVDVNTISNVMNTNGLGLGYQSAFESKEAIDTYIALFGLEKTNEEIYYK